MFICMMITIHSALYHYPMMNVRNIRLIKFHIGNWENEVNIYE